MMRVGRNPLEVTQAIKENPPAQSDCPGASASSFYERTRLIESRFTVTATRAKKSSSPDRHSADPSPPPLGNRRFVTPPWPC
jgi:hypothetical protein